MIDQKSVNYPQVLSASAKRFEEAGILVVPVAVGSLANVDELTRIVPSKGVVIKVSSSDDPAVIAQKIMGGAVNGECFRCLLLCFFYILFLFLVFSLLFYCQKEWFCDLVNFAGEETSSSSFNNF